MDLWIAQFELDELLGKDKAKILCAHCGGIRVYIAKNSPDLLGIASILGPKLYALFIKRFSGHRITLPNGRQLEPAKKAIAMALKNGEDAKRIALRLHVTERWVYRVGQIEKENARQLTLF